MSVPFALTLMIASVSAATAYEPMAVFGFVPVFILGMTMVIFK